jgi:hypothetical protein
MKDTTPNMNILAEYWETPITNHQYLWFALQLYTGLNNYIFFENDIDGPADPIYVMTIGAGDTFKISDESDSSIRINKLLKNLPPTLKRQNGRSFKFWNSPLALEASYTLGMTPEEYNQVEPFQYVILTQNETIEFVTSREPKWEIYNGVKLDDLVIQYLKNDLLD